MQNPASILMVTREQGGDRLYGLGRSLDPVVRTLKQRGHRVRYLSQDDLPSDRANRRQRFFLMLIALPIIRSAPRLKALLAAWMERLDMGWFAFVVARQDGYQWIHFHDPWMALGFYLPLRVFGLRGVQWGMTEHGFGSYAKATQMDGLEQGERTQRWLLRIERWILSRADWVIAPTQLALNQLAKDADFKMLPAHWKVIPHPRPDEAFPDRWLSRQQLNIPEEALMVLGVGRLVPLKRFDDLIRAFSTLADRYPKLMLCLLGEGDGNHLKALATSMGYFDRVRFDVREDIRPYLAAADLYVSCSLTESFGLANLEALSAGLPSLCTDVGGVPEVVGSGALLLSADLKDLVPFMDRLLSSSKLRATWSQRALQQAHQWPTHDMIADAYEPRYRV